MQNTILLRRIIRDYATEYGTAGGWHRILCGNAVVRILGCRPDNLLATASTTPFEGSFRVLLERKGNWVGARFSKHLMEVLVPNDQGIIGLYTEAYNLLEKMFKEDRITESMTVYVRLDPV